jgi:3-hydroxymyristoyl/3-hydroxydecanoyl-(acyl carrier protein) dehydratase
MADRATELVELDHRRLELDGVEEHRFSLRVPPDLDVFEDHFPRVSVLPAFVELRLVLARVQRAWPDLGVWRGSSSMKFTAPVRPGFTLELRLRRSVAAPRVSFSITADGATKPCAKGTLLFELA